MRVLGWLGRLCRGARGRATMARMLAIACVIGSPFAPPCWASGEGRAVVYVVDRSLSTGLTACTTAEQYIRDALPQRSDAQVGIVAFSSQPELVLRVGERRAGGYPG